MIRILIDRIFLTVGPGPYESGLCMMQSVCAVPE